MGVQGARGDSSSRGGMAQRRGQCLAYMELETVEGITYRNPKSGVRVGKESSGPAGS